MKKVLYPHSAEIIKIKGSRFIADIVPVNSIEEAMSALQVITFNRKEASHICYGIRITPSSYRYSDDGEPRNSAGLPIFNRLESHNMVACICTVSRYYGGVKLGVGGLIRAYGSAASKVISECQKKETHLVETLSFSYGYSETASVSSVLSAYPEVDSNHLYLDHITTHSTVSVEKKEQFKQDLIEKTSGKIVFHV